MAKRKSVTIQFKQSGDAPSYLFSEEEAQKLVEKFKENSVETLTLEDREPGRKNARIHIKLDTVGIVEEEDGEG